MPSKAKRRMDKLMRHLTAQPATVNSTDSPDSTPHRQNIRRQLASAQKERVFNEFGYELQDELNDPLVQHVDDEDDDTAQRKGNSNKRAKLSTDSNKRSFEDADVSETRKKLAKACKLAHEYSVAGAHLNDDLASAFIPQHGYIFKPLTLRFEEVTPENLAFTKSLDDLPKLHADLYACSDRNTPFCIFSSCNENCEMVAITKGSALLPLCQDALRIHGRVKKVDEGNLGVRAARFTLKDVPCWLVKNRGAVCSSTTVEGALANLVFVVRACTFQIRALAAVGGDLSRLDLLSESDAIRAKAELQERCSDLEAAQNLFRAK